MTHISINNLLAYERYLPVLTTSEVASIQNGRPPLAVLQHWEQRLSNHQARLAAVFGRAYQKQKDMEKGKDSVSVEIINRYFEAVSRLISDGCIRGLQTITRRYGLNRWNVIYLRDNPEESVGRFRPSWLSYLVRDYHVSPYWLLLGSGDFYAAGFTPEIIKKLTKNCTEK